MIFVVDSISFIYLVHDKMKKGGIKMSQYYINIKCVSCGTMYKIKFTEEQYQRFTQWKAGGINIQDALPDFSADERELLLSSICGTCYDKMFKD